MNIHRQVKEALLVAGFSDRHLHSDFTFGHDSCVDMAAFCQSPEDIRSSAVAFLTATDGNTPERVKACRELGAPIVFTWTGRMLEWWKQTPGEPIRLEEIPKKKIASFFQQNKIRKDLDPQSILRAKNQGRFNKTYQRSFIDDGLMNIAEQEIGRHVSRLIENVIVKLRQKIFAAKDISNNDGQWLFKTVFWLLAGKILHDKHVDNFKRLDLCDFEKVFERVGKHYNDSVSSIVIKGRKKALTEAAETISQFASLRLITTESLAYIYENTLISKKTRQKLGTHSTPSYLIDYMVWQLVDWIEEIPEEERYVFEPACGHAGFLVSATRLLRELLGNIDTKKRRTYLRQHIVGCERDGFSLEVARLSLTLADIPNPNGWQLHNEDMFVGHELSEKASQAKILLANPPFEAFTAQERTKYKKQLTYRNKAAEMVAKTIPYLPKGAVFGLVLPQSFLQSDAIDPLRQEMLKTCELREITLFPDKIFRKADPESCIILGRKNHNANANVNCSRVRHKEIEQFKESFDVSFKDIVFQTNLCTSKTGLRNPTFPEIWKYCNSMPQLRDFVSVRRGIEYVSRKKADSDYTHSYKKFKNAHSGFPLFKAWTGNDTPESPRKNVKVFSHTGPSLAWMNLSSEVIKQKHGGDVALGTSQILLNYIRVSREPWRLTPFMDKEGYPVTNAFLTLRRLNKKVCNLEIIWALLNSPFANAYVYCHTDKRHNLEGLLRSMPIPNNINVAQRRIAQLVRQYHRQTQGLPQGVKLASQTLFNMNTNGKGIKVVSGNAKKAKQTLLKIDAEILRLYDLPPLMERELLDLFAGEQRSGVPFDFVRYYPEDFEPCVPLHEYISKTFQSSTVGKLKGLHEKIEDPELLTALNRAVVDFGEED